MKFRVTLFTSDYLKVGAEGEYKCVETASHYMCRSWDGLNNFINTIIESSERSSVKFEIKKFEPEEREVEDEQ